MNKQEENKKVETKQCDIHVVMMRNFMKSSKWIDKIEGERIAYIQGYYEWQEYFKKSKSTYYRYIKKLKKSDKNFWYCNVAKLLFYYA